MKSLLNPIDTKLPRACVRIEIAGRVQGVGFRPFVYRLSQDLRLGGWIQNTSQGVIVEVEGTEKRISIFVRRLKDRKPSHSRIDQINCVSRPPRGYRGFEIRESFSDLGRATSAVMADLATCQDCLNEIFDPRDRRYLYPFTNCTCCGPRYSILERLPYDRPHTSMKSFQMCPSCQSEYDDPSNRRFHAQPNACWDCGPRLELLDGQRRVLADHRQAISSAISYLKEGLIVAVKGLGGFHLMVNALDEKALRRLRQRKQRPDKPFAVMFRNAGAVSRECEVSSLESSLLNTPAAPIILLKKRSNFSLAQSVSPENPSLGAFLAHTPIQHILLSECDCPLVATSANLSDEPICTDNDEAIERLSAVADFFVVHNRGIVRHADDSLIRVIEGRPAMLRRARGFAPLPVAFGKNKFSSAVLAVGGHQKNTVSLNAGNQLILSQHIGDLDLAESRDVFVKTIESLRQIYDGKIDAIACDSHPDYASTKFAESFGCPIVKVQHHYAHVASAMVDNHVSEKVLGVCFDGTGFGTDGTIWGGEFLECDFSGYSRVGHLKRFPLIGGETALREPVRCALGILFELSKDNWAEFSDLEILRTFPRMKLETFQTMLSRRFNTPLTSSVGRLFDGIAALLNLFHKVSFEGQAAMALEFLAEKSDTPASYPASVLSVADASGNCVLEVDWSLAVRGVLGDLRNHVSADVIARKFHNFLIDCVAAVVQRVGRKKVVLSGGCFQNKVLCEGAVQKLKQLGFVPLWHKEIPTNDGGISIGQLAVAAFRADQLNFSTL